MNRPKLDIVICGHNEAPNVPRVLASLKQQSVPTDQFHAIYVDSASDDDTANVVESNRNGLDLTYLRIEQPGLNFARNAGTAAARSDFIAFLDADAMAHMAWVESILRTVNDTQAELYGGPYYPFYVTRKPGWFLDRYNSVDLGDTARELTAREYLNGTNMIWCRSLIDLLGGFEPSVGVVGRSLARGDETELILRARRELSTFRAYYSPDIIVYHLTRPNTMSLIYWARRHFIYGRNSRLFFDSAADSRDRELFPMLRRCRHTAWRLLRALLKAAIYRDRMRYPYLQNYIYEEILPELSLFGILSDVFWPTKRPVSTGAPMKQFSNS